MPNTTTLRTLAGLGAAALLTLPLAAAAQSVYRCPGPDSRYIYTDKPCPGQRLRINNKGLGTSVTHETITRTGVRKPSPGVAPAASAATAAPAAEPASAPASGVEAPAPAPVPANPTAQGVQL